MLSNKPAAAGLERAAELGVPTEVIDSKRIKPRKAHERQVIELLKKYKVELICLAGYMRLLSPLIISEFRERIINIHPSLLPAFPGLDAQRQAYVIYPLVEESEADIMQGIRDATSMAGRLAQVFEDQKAEGMSVMAMAIRVSMM